MGCLVFILVCVLFGRGYCKDVIDFSTTVDRWCTTTDQEQNICERMRTAAISLGVQQRLSCQQRPSVIDCLRDVSTNQTDFSISSTRHGYMARQHYDLTPIKFIRSEDAVSVKILILVKIGRNITNFEDFRAKVACFPEFSGLAYMAFLLVATQRGAISAYECDYAKAVGEFFSMSCAPGALDEDYAGLEASTFNATTLCKACQRDVSGKEDNTYGDPTCAADKSNVFYGDKGALLCFTNRAADVAVLDVLNLEDELQSLNSNDHGVMCANGSVIAYNGTDLPAECYIAEVVPLEILIRRDNPNVNRVRIFLEKIEAHFGYAKMEANLINLPTNAPVGEGNNDFAIILMEPTKEYFHQSKNYIEILQNFENCISRLSYVVGQVGRALIFIATLAARAVV